MKVGFNNRKASVVFLILVMTLLGSCNFPSKAPTATEFFVSVKGSDTTGDGSKSKPWRHIQYTVDHASPKPGNALVINILKGIYEEELVINKPMTIKGAGIGKTTTWANDPLYPQEEVSVITVTQITGNPRILIKNATSVNLQNLVIQFGGIHAINTRFIMYNVEIPNSNGESAVRIENCPLFYIEKSKIKTSDNTRSDFGIKILASSGDILETYLGNQFDHVIHFEHPNFGPNEIQSINIRDTVIEGSDIYFADGIRLQAPVYAKISNTKITRTHPNAEAANSGTPHTPPYAAIEIGGTFKETMKNVLVEVDGVTASGFDVAIGIVAKGLAVKVQNSDISGIKYDVETSFTVNPGFLEPIVDFGGGPLGSVGKNKFALNTPYAFYNNVPYDTYACFNDWVVPVTKVDSARIFDKLDVPTKGRVNWLCQMDIVFPTLTPTRKPTSTPFIPIRSTFTPTPGKVRIAKDALCFEGPGKKYPVVSAVRQGEMANILGIGLGGTYYVIENPRFFVPCWIEITVVEYYGDPSVLRIYAIPPTPTPTRPPDRPDPPTAAPRRP